MADDIAIKVSHVSKDFVLPHEKVGSLKSAFTGMFNGGRSKEAQHALRDITFEVKKGEFFGIVGRNGSGKSTMLKILASIYQPTKGTVATNGKLVPFIELGVGFNQELTGRENVFLNGAMLGFARKEVEAMYNDIVAFAELERFMDQKLKNYSSGMQVRLAFSMATRSEADILLVDEVLAVGDADFQRKCFSYFKELKKNKKTVVFVSHDMSAVREYCDRAVLIEKSKLIMEDRSDRIATAYSRMFMEDAANNASVDVTSKRWGNRKLKFAHVDFGKDSVTKAADEITVTVKLTSTETMNNPVIGFVIKNKATGDDIVGTNTKLERTPVGQIGPGKTRTITWHIPNLFADGDYIVNVAALEEDSITVCDWWEGAALFKSYEEIPSPYAIQPIIRTVME